MDFRARYQFDVEKDMLGKGDFSRVYRANDTLLERVVALKFFTANASGQFRILDEIKKGIGFDHPNLCKYYGVEVLSAHNIIGEQERIEVGIMEYMDGGDFKSYIAAHPGARDKLLVDVLNGLSYLHERGIVHRDLRGENILIRMVDDKPVAKITNFRNSQAIGTSEDQPQALSGTIESIAPEQFNPEKYGIGGRIATNLDLWSFGLLLYETLDAVPLFGSRSAGVSAEQIMANILSDGYLARVEAVPPKYRNILRLCLVKEASKRVRNAADLLPLLEEPGPARAHVFVTQQALSPNIVDARQKKEDPETDNSTAGDTGIANTEKASAMPVPVSDSLANRDAQPKSEKALEQPAPIEDDFARPVTIGGNRWANDLPAIPAEEERGSNAWQQRKEPPARLGEKAAPVRLGKPAAKKPAYTAVEKDNRPYVNEPVKKATGTKAGKLPAWVSRVIGLLVVVLFIVLILRRPGDAPDYGQDEKQSASGQGKPLAASAPQMVAVQGGAFLMGFDGKGATDSEKPVHPVLVSDFSMGKYEVTIGEFRNFVTATGYKTTAEKEGSTVVYDASGSSKKANLNWRHDVNGNMVDAAQANLPVVHVSWYDAAAYCKWLSEKTGQQFRLPTEAEWEYAALGGKKGYHDFNSDSSLAEVSWNGANSEKKYHEVGGKKPNVLGLHDMIGNVYEWCADWYDERTYRSGTTENPAGPKSGSSKVIRGGSWYRDGGSEYYRPSIRFLLDPKERGAKVGFRICSSTASKK